MLKNKKQILLIGFSVLLLLIVLIFALTFKTSAEKNVRNKLLLMLSLHLLTEQSQQLQEKRLLFQHPMVILLLLICKK